MRLVLRQQSTYKPLGRSRWSKKRECKTTIEAPGWQEDLAHYMNVQAVTEALKKADYRVEAAGHIMMIDLPSGVYSNKPAAVHAEVSQIVIKNAGKPLGFVDAPDPLGSPDEPTADHLALRLTYMGSEMCRWNIGADGWNGPVGYVINFNSACLALRDARYEVDWSNTQSLLASAPSKYLYPDNAELVVQGRQLATMVQPFLRVRHGALEPVIHTGA